MLALTAAAFPPAPMVSNLVAAQAINSASNFTLQFLSRPKANSNDFTQLYILDGTGNTVFSTHAPDQYPEQALTGTNDNIVISAGTLLPGKIYTGQLIFTRTTTNSVYKFTGYPLHLAGFISECVFTLQTQGGVQPAPPPPPAPPVLNNTLLTITPTNGTGSFNSVGTFELFTSPYGTNYMVLGAAGGGLQSGGYAYVQLGTNTGLMTFPSTPFGAATLQLVYNSTSAGTFVLSNSAGTQTGVFAAAASYETLNPPNLFMPRFTNGQFHTFLSGNPGVNYTVETSTDLSHWTQWTNLMLADLSVDIADTTSRASSYYRVGSASLAFAPGEIAGQSFNTTIGAGSGPFSTNGTFQWTTTTNGNSYQAVSVSGATNGAGTYSYAATGPSTAVISFTNSASAETYNEQLVFTSPLGGFFYTTNTTAGGFQSGSFNLTAAPALFLGNVQFTADTARGTSGMFAPGSPMSLSVTDAVGYVWTLNVPADALLSSATISMSPFAAIDSSAAALPLVSGVRLGPEGIQFSDGVTLMLTPAAALGPHAALMLGTGSGAGLSFVQTTNQGMAYSTTLFHFSSAGATDPSDQQWQNYQNQHLAQAEAAYNEAQSQVKALEGVVVQPPEPPDDPFQCSGSNPAADAQVDLYVKTLFARENAAAQNLESAAHALVLLTGDASYSDNAIAAVRQLIETAGFRKVNALLAGYNSAPLKFAAVAKAAMAISRQDELLGGPGLPDLLGELESWLAGNVLDYYWKQLLNQHDYTMANVLLQIEHAIALFGGTIDLRSFVQQVASGYTFRATMTVSDLGNQLAIKAHGAVTITGDPQLIFPISGATNNFSYDSGTYIDCRVNLPAEFGQGAFLVLGCTNNTADIFIVNDMASLNETWSCPDGSSPPGDVLSLDFGQAFSGTHGTQNIAVNYNCSYVFTVPWQNLQAEPANATFSGPGEYVANDTVVFTFTVDHTPDAAPQKLTP